MCATKRYGSTQRFEGERFDGERFEFGYLDYYDGKRPCDVATSVFETTKTATVGNIAEYTSVSS